MSTYQTAPHTYIQKVIESMARRGFELLALIKMDSDQHAYYVDLHNYAKHTRLFFHVPNKTMIVMLELIECFSDEKNWTYHYWHGWVNVRWNRNAEYKYMLDNDWERVREMYPQDVGFFVGEAIEKRSPFRMSSGGFEQKETRNPAWLPADEVTAVFGEIKDALLQFMYHKYIEYQVTEYPPHYCFPGCEEWFWRKFPLSRLLKKVKRRIYGSDGIPTPR